MSLQFAEQHPDGGPVGESFEKCKSFNNLLFISGLSHLEMNIVKYLFIIVVKYCQEHVKDQSAALKVNGLKTVFPTKKIFANIY